MCTTCCKQFQAWCRAFTATEVFLSILQAILLAFFVAFLTFLILHLIACSDNDVNTEKYDTSKKTTEGISITTTASSKTNTSSASTEHVEMFTTLAPGIECTWTPSVKTPVVSQYFEHDETLQNVTVASEFKRPLEIQPDDEVKPTNQSNTNFTLIKKPFILVLIKMSPHNTTFGCIVSIISEFWAVTAASCIKSDETDHLDSFVMMYNDLEDGQGYAISSMVIHPQYQGINSDYDIMLIKSKDKFVTSKHEFVKLPSLIDYFLITIGERLTILKFGKTWYTRKEAGSRDVVEVSVHALPARRCGAAPAVARLCAGRLRPAAPPAAPRPPAGAPLLRGGLLLGVASGLTHREVTDAPALYVNLAPIVGWLNSVVTGE